VVKKSLPDRVKALEARVRNLEAHTLGHIVFPVSPFHELFKEVTGKCMTTGGGKFGPSEDLREDKEIKA
jgi:hypothetical protein